MAAGTDPSPTGVPPRDPPNLVRRALRTYLRAYEGLSAQTWRLSAVCFIQRAGTMVLPFFTVFLARERGMDAVQVASILLWSGVGAICGSLLATRSIRRVGTRTNMLASLALCLVAFFFLYNAQGYAWLATAAFALSLCEGPFRPALMAEVAATARPGQEAQAIALVRLGVNAGMMLGPAVGGVLALHSYGLLFLVDAATCLLAGLYLLWGVPTHVVRTSPVSAPSDTHPAPVESPPAHFNRRFVLILLARLVQFLIVFQLMSTVPLYLASERGLLESQVGLYFFINGLAILTLEMGLVRWVRRWPPGIVFGLGCAVMGLGVAAVGIAPTTALIYLTVPLWTLGEMVSMPLLTALALQSAGERKGEYMGWLSAATNVALLTSGPAGLWIASHFGYPTLWLCIAMAGVLSLGLGLAIHRASPIPAKAPQG